MPYLLLKVKSVQRDFGSDGSLHNVTKRDQRVVIVGAAKNYLTRRNLLLFNRRLFCIARPSSVLFGCLSTLNRSGENAAKCLVSEAFIAENATKRIQDPRNVVASRSTFAVQATFGEKRYACFGRIESASGSFLA